MNDDKRDAQFSALLWLHCAEMLQGDKDEALAATLRFDALHEAEQITKMDYKTDPLRAGPGGMNLTTAIGLELLQMKSAVEKKLLQERKDTYWNMPLDEYLAVIDKFGFELVLCDEFTGKSYGASAPPRDKFYIYAHREHGLILSFDSYDAKSVNGGKVRYNLKPTVFAEHGRPAIPYDALSSGGFRGSKDDPTSWVYVGDHDCRVALIFNLTRLMRYGAFMPKWVEQPFLWFLSYMDTEVAGYDYEAITAERISRLPDWVQEIIGPYPEESDK